MKLFVTVLLILTLAICPALAAELDLTALSPDELTQLRDRISLELAARASAPDALGVWDTPLAHVELLSIFRGTTDKGEPGVGLRIAWTNMGTEASNFRKNHWVTVYHDGAECPRVIFLDGVLVNNDTWGMKVLPGGTLEMQWFFQLTGTQDTIVVEIEDYSGRQTVSAGFATVALPPV